MDISNPSDHFTDKKQEQMEGQNRAEKRKPHVKAMEQTHWRLVPGQASLGCALATDAGSSLSQVVLLSSHTVII